MNEWDLQVALTERWLCEGVPLSEERALLLAWEVMLPTWQINDASTKFNLPSIDFVAVDRFGHLVAIELKVRVPGRRPALAAILQVTDRALRMSATCSIQNAQAAAETCLSGRHGRVPVAAEPLAGLFARHQSFYELDQPLVALRRGVRRVVAACSFGPRFDEVLSSWNELPLDAAIERLLKETPSLKSSAAKELRRITDQGPPAPHALAGPVERLLLRCDSSDEARWG